MSFVFVFVFSCNILFKMQITQSHRITELQELEGTSREQSPKTLPLLLKHFDANNVLQDALCYKKEMLSRHYLQLCQSLRDHREVIVNDFAYDFRIMGSVP